MNISELHKGLITRTAGQSKLMDPCTRPLQDMPAATRTSLAKEMHASEPEHHACIPCMLHLVMPRSPNHTLINIATFKCLKVLKRKYLARKQPTQAHKTATTR